MPASYSSRLRENSKMLQLLPAAAKSVAELPWNQCLLHYWKLQLNKDKNSTGDQTLQNHILCTVAPACQHYSAELGKNCCHVILCRVASAHQHYSTELLSCHSPHSYVSTPARQHYSADLLFCWEELLGCHYSWLLLLMTDHSEFTLHELSPWVWELRT